MKTSFYKTRQGLLLSGILWLFAGSNQVEATVYVSNLGDVWTSGGIGDIHALFPGGTPYGTDTARFTTGAGNSFTINALTLEFSGIPTQELVNFNLQLYQQTGNVFLGSFGNPAIDSQPTQWPGYTSFIDFSPLAPIILSPSSQYYVVASVPAGSSAGVALLFTTSPAYTTPTDWAMGTTTTGNPYANGEHLVLAIDATPVPEPNTGVIFLIGGLMFQIGCHLFRWHNKSLQATTAGPTSSD